MKMRFLHLVMICFCVAGLGLVSCAGLSGSRASRLHARAGEDKIDVYVGDSLFTTYNFTDSRKYPFFWPVNGPVSGQSVTTQQTEPYPHHSSLFFACDFVNGANYWQEGLERGQILSQGVKLLKKSGKEIVFEDTCLWRVPGQEPVIEDQRRVTISAPDETVRFIDFEITLKALTPVTIKQSNHSLFSARMTPELNVENGGTLVNAEGGLNRQGTEGVESAWCDYYGTRAGVTEGLAILQNPSNRWYPCKWLTRDYGFFSPTPVQWLNGGTIELSPAESPLRLNYRVVVHAGDSTEADISGLFARYAKSRASSR